MATYHLRVKDDTKSGGKRISAKKHVDYILREEGEAHADYINREGAQSGRDDCVFKGNQLPKWAKGSAQKFFSAATRYEDKGNVRYREIELSLPNELSLEQNLEIVSRFIAEHLSSHYYAFAIHEKVGELSGERHPHVHIMFSERLIDDVEKISERPACKYFRRAAKPLKGEQVASFERRLQHVTPKKRKAALKNATLRFIFVHVLLFFLFSALLNLPANRRLTRTTYFRAIVCCCYRNFLLVLITISQ